MQRSPSWLPKLNQRPNPASSTPGAGVLETIIPIIILVLILVLAFAATFPTAAPASSDNAASVDSDFARWRESAQRLVLIGTPDAFRTLIQSFRQGTPIDQRNAAMQLVAEASSPNVAPALYAALTDSDPAVRAGAAQVLGMRHDYAAIDSLLQATFDDKAQVRREAIRSLVQLDAWDALPRLDQLVVYELQDDVRQAANAARDSFRTDAAMGIGIPLAQVRDVALSNADMPQAYAVTDEGIYARGDNRWERIGDVPDVPVALAAGKNVNLVFLATQSNGLYRSLDGGRSWEHLQFGLNTPTQMSVTAVVIDPRNDNRVFIALATEGATAGTKSGVGASISNDGGKTWQWLDGTPMQVVTTKLALDPATPEYLYGIADDTPWRYPLSQVN